MAARLRRDRDAAAGARRPARDLDLRGRPHLAHRRAPTRAATSATSASAACSRPASTRTPTSSSSARWTWGRASRARSSAAPGTSARARRSPSLCPARRSLAGSKIESREAPRRGLGRDDPLRARARARPGPRAGSWCSADGLEPGTPLADVLPLSEDVLEVEVTGNRPDLLGDLRSRARDRGAVRAGALAAARARTRARRDEPVDVEIADLEGCPRFIGRLFRGVTIGPSPVWLQGAAHRRRDAADLERRRRRPTTRCSASAARSTPSTSPSSRNGARILVRRAAPGEELRTLDDTLRRLDPARPRDRRRRASRRARRDHGRRRDRGRRRHDRRPARGGQLRADRDPGELRAARPAHRGLEPVGEGRRPIPRRAGGDAARPS